VMNYSGKLETDSAIPNFVSRFPNSSLNISLSTGKGRIRPHEWISVWRSSQSDIFCVLKMIYRSSKKYRLRLADNGPFRTHVLTNVRLIFQRAVMIGTVSYLF
jgi:hypothetical protein